MNSGVNNRQRLMIHIGVPKTATTSLQFGFFPRHPDIRYLGKPYYDDIFGYEGSLATAELIDSLWKLDEFGFDEKLAERRFTQGIHARLADNTLAVLSEEGLSQASATDRSLTAHRLADLCRDIDCSILITIREQKRALFSLHQWLYARRFIDYGFDDWKRWCCEYSSYYGSFNDYPLRQYRYARLVETYQDLFGLERVLVLPMEKLVEQPRNFYSALEDFAGISSVWGQDNGPVSVAENRSPGRMGIRYQRTVKGIKQLAAHLSGRRPLLSEALEQSKLHTGMMQIIERFDTPMRPMTQTTATWLDDYYRGDNEALARLTGLDLAAYGYTC